MVGAPLTLPSDEEDTDKLKEVAIFDLVEDLILNFKERMI